MDNLIYKSLNMYTNHQGCYCYKYKIYSCQEIQDRLKTISDIDKAELWVYPDLTTQSVSRMARIIRAAKFPLTWLADRFYVFRKAIIPLNWFVNRIYQWNGIDIEKSKLFLAEIKKCALTYGNSPIAIQADKAINQFNRLFPKHQVTHKIQSIQSKYCYNKKKYSYQEIQDRLKTISDIDKAKSWVYPDLTTQSVSRIARIIRAAKFPLTWLADRFYVFRKAIIPLNWFVNRIYQWNGIDIEKSKLFLAEIKKCARTNFDSPIAIQADKAINQFNRLFPKHQVTHEIQLPLLDTSDKEYNLNLFECRLPDDAKYLGANQVVINQNNRMPRTLYHLFFIYFALKNGNDKEKYQILEFSNFINKDRTLLREEEQQRYEQTVNRLHPEILNFFKEKDLTLDQLTWGDVKVLVDDICKEFGATIYESRDRDSSSDSRQNLFYNFYRFCFSIEDHGAKFKKLALRALALEWESSFGTEILYRGAKISADDISNGENCVHSLSFSSSLFSGLVFEGSTNGTCPYVYYNYSDGKQLYVLKLSSSKLEKYFFYPKIFKSYDLLPLTAKGEFSHPRLKVFTTEKTTKIGGAQSEVKRVKKFANFTPSLKIKDPETYRKKVTKLFQKNIYLLGA
jgi:hypothetical protein